MKPIVRRAAALASLVLLASCVPSAPDRAAEEGPDVVAEVRVDAVREAVWSADGRRLAATWVRPTGPRLVGLFGPQEEAPPQEGSGLPLADGDAAWATWSPDGLWVAYAAGTEGGRDIVRARPDGMGPETLTSDPADDYDPAFSPDGRTLAFVSTRGEGVPRLHVMDADGGNVRFLAELPGAVRRPMWSPDGGRIAVQVEEAGEAVVYLVTADGRGQGRLGPGAFPAWFPDGERVVFSQNDSLFWRPANGGLRHLVAADARMGRPSPDGRWMAFVRGDSLTSALHLLDLETGTEVRITPR